MNTKIIHLVLGKANPQRMNGVNKVAYHLARTQFDEGYDVCLWGIANSLEHNYPPRKFPTELFRQYRAKHRLDPRLVEAIAALPAHTIIHFHGSFIPEFARIARRLYKQGIPYVYTPHGALTQGAMQHNAWLKRLYFQLIEKPFIRRAKAIQLLGEQEYSDLDKLATGFSKVLIPNGQDWDEIPVVPHREVHQEPVFGFCGRLDAYHKGLDLMLAAFRQLLEQGYAARLELIGDGKDRAQLQKYCQEHGIADRVTFHGARYGAEKFAQLSQFDLFLHTSRMEGFPVAVLEAAALGLPCLTTQPTSINPYLETYGSGIAISHLSPEAISQAMSKAADLFFEKRLQPLQENARRMVREAFDWNHIARQLIDVYHA